MGSLVSGISSKRRLVNSIRFNFYQDDLTRNIQHKMKLACSLVAICLVIFVTNADAKPYKETKAMKVNCPEGRMFMYQPANKKSGILGGCCKIGDTFYTHSPAGKSFCCPGKNPGFTFLGINFRCKKGGQFYWPSYFPSFTETKGNGNMKMEDLNN